MSILLATVCIGGAILILVTLGLIIVSIIKAVRTGGISRKERDAYAEETQMIQDMFNSLSKMEERVEALETILIERGHKNQ